MRKINCPNCGELMQGDECPRCRATTAIAKPEHAEQAKVTPPTDGAIREGEPPLPIRREEAWPYKSEPGPASGCSCVIYILLGLIISTALCVLMPISSRVREASARTISINNMKQIAISCHAHQDVHKRLPNPTMIAARDGKDHEVPLSWRVSILPFIELNHLLKEFDLTVGWDHQNNTALHDRMPSLYHCPYRDEATSTRATHFQCFTGPNTLFPDNAPRTLQEIRDGSSNTLLFAEGDQTVIWSRPADLTVRRDQPLPLPEKSFLAALADGTVRHIDRERISDAVLRQLIHPNDQKPDEGWDN